LAEEGSHRCRHFLQPTASEQARATRAPARRTKHPVLRTRWPVLRSRYEEVRRHAKRGVQQPGAWRGESGFNRRDRSGPAAEWAPSSPRPWGYSNPGFEIIIAVKEAPVALTATRLPSDW